MRFAALTIMLGGSIAVFACTGGGGSTGTTSGSSSGGSSSGGSSSGSSTEPAGSPGQEDRYCEAHASHLTCNGGTSTDPCEEDAKCIYGRLMSKTAADAYNACYSAPSCKSDDNCAGEAGKAAGGAAADKFTTDCLAKLQACPDAGDVPEVCGPTLFAYPDVRDAAVACIEKPCNELAACLEAAIKPIADCKK